MKLAIPVPTGFSLRATVLSHGWYQTEPFRWDDTTGTLSRIDRPDGSGDAREVRVTEDGGALDVEVPGARSVTASYRRRLERMFQLEWELAPFHRLVRRDRATAWISRKRYGRVLRSGDVFEDLAKAIMATNIQWPQAVRIANAVSTLGPARGGRHAFPTPGEVIDAGEGWLRAHARAGYRARYLVDLARLLSDGSLDPDALEQAARREEGPSFRKRLLAVRGVGRSTARALGVFFSKFDAVNVDSAVAACASRIHFGGRATSAPEIERHYARYGDYAGLVSWFEVWGDHCRRHGIRL